MRNGSHRFWLCIAAVVAVSAIAVPAAGAALTSGWPTSAAGVHKYDTELTRIYNGSPRLFGGGVESEVRKCMVGRRVTLFKVRPGADRKLATDRTSWGRIPTPDETVAHGGTWGVRVPEGSVQRGDRVYARVMRKERSRFVCLADSRALQL